MDRSPLVSVLMPAYKPTYFRPALESVVAQTHGEIEILVGDNAGDGAVQAIVDAVGDARVTVIPSHSVSGGSPRLNHLLLWNRARGRYARFVYDDDLLHPRSTEVLLAALRDTPRCVMAYHQRYLIDGDGQMRGRVQILAEGTRAVMNRPLVLENFISFFNFIGEPSFVMFDREALSHFGFNRYARVDTAYLWDIAMYLEACRDGLVAGCSDFLGSFRIHGSQVSQHANLWNAVEWELVFRQELCDGFLDEAQFGRVVPRLLADYRKALAQEPRLEAFAQRLAQDAAQGQLREGTPLFRREYLALREHRARPAPAVAAGDAAVRLA